METFLEKLAKELIKSEKLFEKTIILPNKRAGIFLQKELSELSTKPILSPKIITIEDFIQQNSPWQNIDWLNLVFIFYEAYQDYYTNNKIIDYIKSFDEFVKWAPIVLRDFEDIDKFLLNPKQVFNYLSEVKILEQWNLENSNSKFIKEYQIYFKSLYGLYQALNDKLKNKNLAYKGLMYRYVAENIDEISRKYNENQIVFAGFNALTKAEEKIFKNLSERQIANVYYDADKYYMQKHFEAGTFLREHKRKSTNFKWETDNFHSNKEIEIIQVTGKTAQMRIVSQIISDKIKSNPEQNLTETAVVLNENNLLFPLLDSLPENIDAINITLGLPITDLPVIQIFTQISKLYFDYEQYGKFKAQNIFEILDSPYLIAYFSDDEIKAKDKLKNRILKFGSKLIPSVYIKNKIDDLPELLQDIFSIKPKVDDLLKLFSKLTEIIIDKNIPKTDKIALLKLENIFAQINEFNNKTKVVNNIKTLSLIISKLLAGENLFFEGKPLEGLQVMGLLETRLLDFEHIILTSVNENILPIGKKEQSLIPFDIKVELGLPTYKNQTAIMAYHFYRLLQRAKKITLIYDNDISGLNSGEASRFITQIQNELPAYHSGISIVEKQLKSGSSLIDNDSVIEKTDKVLALLDERAESGWSPSTLDTYIMDPIQFVKSRLLKLTEEEELIEGIPANVFGTIVHNTLEKLYKKHQGNFLKLDDLVEMQKSYQKIAKEYFYKEVKTDFQLTGKKHIALAVIFKNINDIIEMDKKIIKANKKLKIIDLEVYLEHFIQLNGKKIKLKGYVDRIDELNGQLRIIDYKTGNVKQEDLTIKKYDNNLSMIIEKISFRKIFQVLTYIWLYSKNNKITQPISGGIISSRKYRQGIYPISFNNDINISQDIIDEYERVLLILLEKIYNADVSFSIEKD